MSGYQLGIDLGTTRSATAVCRSGADRPEPAAASVATAVYAGADGSFLVGDEARARALAHPARVVDGFVRRVGDPTPVLLGREPVAAEALVARFVSRLTEPVTAREGAGPAGLALAHPTGWGRHRVESLRAVLGGRPAMVPQAVAAVLGHARDLEPGALVAVHDLGGATFDAAVVRVVPGGAELVAPAEGLERFGGNDVDEAVFAHVRAGLGRSWTELDGGDPAVREAVARLRLDCTLAKERLSADTEVVVGVRLPGRAQLEVRVARAELEEAIRGPVSQTVDTLARALESAGVASADLADVLLVGGSARIPLVAQLVSAGLGRAVTVAADPKGVFAEGAALWAARRAAGAGRGAGRGAGCTAGAGVGRAAAGGAAAGAGAGPAAGAGGVGARGDASDSVPLGPGDRDPRRPAVPRPPKQARAFPTEEAAQSRLPLFVGVGLLVLTILGALVVVGASRYAAENSAVATTPSAVNPAGQQGAASSPRAVTPSPEVPTRRPVVTAPPATTPAPSTTTTAPSATSPRPPEDADGQGDQSGDAAGGGDGAGSDAVDGGGQGGGGQDGGGQDGGGQDVDGQGAGGQGAAGQGPAGAAASTTPPSP